MPNNYPYQIKLIAFLTLALALLVSSISLISKVGTQPTDSSRVPVVVAGAYYHSIEEMQEWSGAEVDGIWGPETDRLYRAKWARQYCDKMALETFEVK